MKSSAPKRQHDEMKIPNGRYFEQYTPIAGPITSAAIKDKNGNPARLLFARICLSVNSNVTYKDGAGNNVVAFPHQAGEHWFLVTEITANSAGVIAIIHDGEVDTQMDGERA